MNALYGFISTGDKVAMYTLRIMYELPVHTNCGLRMILKDYFVQNLSNDRETAINKAIQILSEQDLELNSDADFDLNEIKRARSEERQEIEEAIKKAEIERKEKIDQFFLESVRSDVFLCGKYVGFNVNDVACKDIHYLFWLASQEVSAQKSKFDINIEIAKKYITNNNIELPGFVGSIGDEIQVELTLKSVYWTQGQFPTLCYSCVTDDNKLVKFYSMAKAFKELKESEKFRVKAIVKHHNEHNSNKVSILNKPRMAK